MNRSSSNLDATDRAIIEHLQADGRIPFTRLGTAVGLSEAATRQRVQRLIEGGAVQIVAVTNPLALGRRRMAMIGVRTAGPIGEVAETLRTMDDVEYLVITAGAYDFMCEVVVGDDTALLEVTNRIREIPGVTTTETFIYLDLVKQTFAWGAH
jgi:Lrp/AsnC family transcriptional regulator, regulator for asnA, asnC and gidA